MRLLAQAHSRNLHLAWRLRTFHAYTQDRLGLPKSTVDRWLHVQYRLWVTPSIDTEWRAHRLNLTQTDLLLDVVNERTAPAWLEYANRVALLQLKQDVAQARTLQREFPGQDVLPPTREDAIPMDVSIADLLRTKNAHSDSESDSSCSLPANEPKPDTGTASTCSPRPLRVGAAPLTMPGLSDGFAADPAGRSFAPFGGQDPWPLNGD
jgi:hypothetical protein